MKNLIDFFRGGFLFLTAPAATAAILAAVLAASFFAFWLDAEPELVGGLLALGVATAVVEAKLLASTSN